MASFELYHHHCPNKLSEAFSHQISIVLYGSDIAAENVARSVATHLRQHTAPSRVVIFGLPMHAALIKELLEEDSTFAQRLIQAWGKPITDEECFGIIRSTGNELYEAIGHANAGPELIAMEVAHASTMTAQAIFRNAGCIQEAPQGSHYSKTSKSHSSAFIRASNALATSANTLTLAYWLHPFVSQKADRILVDTSAIASVVYAACHMCTKTGHLADIPAIESFRSYEGISQDELENSRNTLFVISASTSGNLARYAFQKKVLRNRLITLFLLSAEQTDQDSICYLKKDKLVNPEGFELINSWKEDECLLCKAGSIPIQIGGDLFLTALPATKEIQLARKHIPQDQRKTIEQFAGLGIFRVHRKIGDKISEITLDVKPLFEATSSGSKEIEKFRDEWYRLLRRHIPANTSHVVHPIYPESDMLAHIICTFANGLNASKDLQPIDGKSLTSAPKINHGSAVVVAACIDDQVEMMGINRALRSTIPGGTATYFVPVLKANNEMEAKNACINLTYGDRGANTFSLHQMHTLYLPEDIGEDSWAKELRFLLKFSEWLDDQALAMPGEILNRRAALRISTSSGLKDDLFWPNVDAESLAIRSNFVLLETEDGQRKLTQADIFVVVSSLLNSLRNTDGPDGLRPNQFERRVISPRNFVRYNDGIIQAAILRAARGNELNYVAADTERYSDDMAGIIVNMINNEDVLAREALTEFMLAIATERMRLYDVHMKDIAQAIAKQKIAIPDICYKIAEWILRK